MKEIETLMERAERATRSAELLTKELKFSSRRSVISLFGEHFVKTGIFNPEMGKKLSKTFEKRLAGDYSFAPQIYEEEAEEVLDWAKEFVRDIKQKIAFCAATIRRSMYETLGEKK